MKKKLLLFTAAIISFALAAPVAAFAKGDPNQNIMVAKGLFTDSSAPKGENCKDLGKDFDKKQKEIAKSMNADDAKKLPDQLKGDGGKGADFIGETVNGAVTKPASNLFKVSCGVSLMNTFIKITDPVNITNNPVVMKVIGITQLIALGGAVLLIAIYGVTYTLVGLEGVNPYKFGVRMLFAMLATYALPYLLQDVININNVIVHYVSDISQSASDKNGNGLMAAGVGLAYVFALFASVIITTLIATGGTSSLIWLIIIVIFIVMLAKPMLQIIMWWYFRMLTLFILTIFGPFFVIMMALPQTAKMSTNWMRMYISQTFSQTFLALGLYLFTTIFMNLLDFNSAVSNMGFIGDIFLLYAMVVTMTELPGLAGKLLGGDSNPIGAKSLERAADSMTMAIGSTAAFTGRSINKAQTNKKLKDETGKDVASFSRKIMDGNFITGVASKAGADNLWSGSEARNMSLKDDSRGLHADGLTDTDYGILQHGVLNGEIDSDVKAEERVAAMMMSNNKDLDKTDAQMRAREFVDNYNKNAEISIGTMGDINKDISKGKASQESVMKRIAADQMQRGFGAEIDKETGKRKALTREQVTQNAREAMRNHGYDSLEYDKTRLENAQKRNIAFDKGIENISVGGKRFSGGKLDYKGLSEDVHQNRKKENAKTIIEREPENHSSNSGRTGRDNSRSTNDNINFDNNTRSDVNQNTNARPENRSNTKPENRKPDNN